MRRRPRRPALGDYGLPSQVAWVLAGESQVTGLALAFGAIGISSEAGYGGVGPNFLPWLASWVALYKDVRELEQLPARIETLENEIAPPTINLRMKDPECDLDYVPAAGRKAVIEHAVCNCIAFGSKNSALVIARGTLA